MVPCDSQKIGVGRQQGELGADAQLRQQRVDRADLKSAAATIVPQLGSSNVISALGHEERERRKPLDDCVSRPRPAEPLKQLL